MKEYRKYCLSEGRIVDCGTELISKQTREQYHGDFALVEVENELDNIDNYTIENGQLVLASPEVIAERQAAQAQANAVAEIVELKAYLTSTDWVVTKCMELSTPVVELYPAIHAERNAARARINELEGGANE